MTRKKNRLSEVGEMTVTHAELELVWDTRCSLAESPLWDAQNQQIYFVDLYESRIYAYGIDLSPLAVRYEEFAAAAAEASRAGAIFPLAAGESLEQMLARMTPYFFDANVDPMVTAKTPPPGKDILTASANNLYAGVSMEDLDGFREGHPLNSRLVKTDGRLVEEVYKVGGRYGRQLAAVVSHLEARSEEPHV